MTAPVTPRTTAPHDPAPDDGLDIPASDWPRAGRVYLIPTRFGAAYLGVTVATLIGCINYQLSLGYAVSFALLSLWLVCAVHASRTLGGLRVRAEVGRALAGSGLPVSVFLSGPPGRSARLGASGQRPRGPRLTVTAAAGGEGRGVLTLAAPQRGPLPLPEPRLEGPDPLGLWRGVTYPGHARLGLPVSVVVAPAPERGAPPLPLTSTAWGDDNAARRGAGQDDYAGLREFVPGDSPRRVAWRQVAMAEAAGKPTLLTRVFDAPAPQTLHLSLEAAGQGSLEERLSRLCAWVLEAEQRGLTYALTLGPAVLPPGSGPAHTEEALARLGGYGQPSPAAARPSLRARWGRG